MIIFIKEFSCSWFSFLYVFCVLGVFCVVEREREEMVGTPTLVGACLGLASQLYSNAIRKRPLMRHPWEHVLLMGLGAVAANGLVSWEERVQADLEKSVEEQRQANKRRFLGTMRTVKEN
eukprot:c401_g1_i1 orf=37-396(+)